MSETTRESDARRLATGARDRVHFEEDALELSDQVYRVARHLVGSREEAEDLVQETYARAFRSWRSFTPGTNLRGRSIPPSAACTTRTAGRRRASGRTGG